MQRFRPDLKTIIRFAKWLFTPIAVFFLFVAAWKSREVLLETLSHSSPFHLVLALLAYMSSHLLSPFFARVILNASGAQVCYSQTLNVHLRYLPARYLPGGVWHTVARVSSLYNLGVQSRHLSSFVLLENLMALGVTFLVGGILVDMHQTGGVWGSLALPIAAASLVGLLLLPWSINRWVFRGSGKLALQGYLQAVLIVGLFWISTTTSFLLFISAFPSAFASGRWFEIAGAYLFSWGMGFVAVFAPQGLGVFEFVAADLMSAALPFPALVALLAAFRLLVMVADMLTWLCWTAALLIRRT